MVTSILPSLRLWGWSWQWVSSEMFITESLSPCHGNYFWDGCFNFPKTTEGTTLEAGGASRVVASAVTSLHSLCRLRGFMLGGHYPEILTILFLNFCFVASVRQKNRTCVRGLQPQLSCSSSLRCLLPPVLSGHPLPAAACCLVHRWGWFLTMKLETQCFKFSSITIMF